MTKRKPIQYVAVSLLMFLFAVLPLRLCADGFTAVDIAAVTVFGALAMVMFIRGVQSWRRERSSEL